MVFLLCLEREEGFRGFSSSSFRTQRVVIFFWRIKRAFFGYRGFRRVIVRCSYEPLCTGRDPVSLFYPRSIVFIFLLLVVHRRFLWLCYWILCKFLIFLIVRLLLLLRLFLRLLWLLFVFWRFLF